MLNLDGSRFHAYKELKIINIESLFFAALTGFTLADQGWPKLVCVAAVPVVLIVIRLLFRFRIGILLGSVLFSAFWAYCFSSGWLREGNWIVGTLVAVGIFAACLYAHKMNADEERDNEEGED